MLYLWFSMRAMFFFLCRSNLSPIRQLPVRHELIKAVEALLVLPRPIPRARLGAFEQEQREDTVTRTVGVLELPEFYVLRFFRAPDRSGHLDAISLLLDTGVGGQRTGRWFHRIAIVPDTRPRFDGAATAAPFVLDVTVVPVDEDGALRRELDVTDAQRLQRDLKTLGDVAEDAEVDALAGNPRAPQIAGHQQVAGEVICLPFDAAEPVDVGGGPLLVAVEALLPAAMQDEVAQLVGDGEALTFGTRFAVVGDAPNLVIVGIAHQHAFKGIVVELHRRPDLPNAGAVGIGRQHLPDDFEIDGVGHARAVPRTQPFLDGVGGDGTSEGLRCAQSSVPVFFLAGEHHLEDVLIVLLLFLRHPGVLAEERHVLG